MREIGAELARADLPPGLCSESGSGLCRARNSQYPRLSVIRFQDSGARLAAQLSIGSDKSQGERDAVLEINAFRNSDWRQRSESHRSCSNIEDNCPVREGLRDLKGNLRKVHLYARSYATQEVNHPSQRQT